MFPIKNYKYKIPTENDPGGFGFVRKHDIHTGIDLYCDKDEVIYSISEGVVLDIIKFTGFEESPWWNDTWAVLVYHNDIGTILYGEIYKPYHIKIGQAISEGDIIGRVSTVLKVDKGKNPPNMLHLELYFGEYKDEPVIWNLNEVKPERLENPKNILEKLLHLQNEYSK